MSINDEIRHIEPGDAVYIPPNAKQFLSNSGDEPIVFICIVDPAWRKEDETIADRFITKKSNSKPYFVFPITVKAAQFVGSGSPFSSLSIFNIAWRIALALLNLCL